MVIPTLVFEVRLAFSSNPLHGVSIVTLLDSLKLTFFVCEIRIKNC